MKSKKEIEINSLKEFCATVFGGAKLWSQLVLEAEKDIVLDKKSKGSDNYEGLDNIIKLINDNITEPDNMKITEEQAKRLKENLKEPYKILKKEVDSVRILRVGKTAPEKMVTAAKSIGRFVGEIVASSIYMAGKTVETVGKLIHYTPAAYVLNRMPHISKKETVGVTYYGKEELKRTNFLEIIGQAINQAAQEASLKYGKMPIFAKVAIKSLREEEKTKTITSTEEVYTRPASSFIEDQLRESIKNSERGINSFKDAVQDQVTIEKIVRSLPNLSKGKTPQR